MILLLLHFWFFGTVFSSHLKWYDMFLIFSRRLIQIVICRVESANLSLWKALQFSSETLEKSFLCSIRVLFKGKQCTNKVYIQLSNIFKYQMLINSMCQLCQLIATHCFICSESWEFLNNSTKVCRHKLPEVNLKMHRQSYISSPTCIVTLNWISLSCN